MLNMEGEYFEEFKNKTCFDVGIISSIIHVCPYVVLLPSWQTATSIFIRVKDFYFVDLSPHCSLSGRVAEKWLHWLYNSSTLHWCGAISGLRASVRCVRLQGGITSIKPFYRRSWIVNSHFEDLLPRCSLSMVSLDHSTLFSVFLFLSLMVRLRPSCKHDKTLWRYTLGGPHVDALMLVSLYCLNVSTFSCPSGILNSGLAGC